jgi:hypothetical protein
MSFILQFIVKQNTATRGKFLCLPAVILPTDCVQMANVKTHKREANRGSKRKETCVEAAKEFLLNLAGQGKHPLSMQLIFMALQRIS